MKQGEIKIIKDNYKINKMRGAKVEIIQYNMIDNQTYVKVINSKDSNVDEGKKIWINYDYLKDL